MPPFINIIILNYNGSPDTIELLECFTTIQESNFRIVLVDNLSTDDSVSKIELWIKEKNHPLFNDSNRFIFIKNTENGGYAKGNNIGIKYSIEHMKYDYLWLLNNDTTIENNCFEIINEFFSKNENRIGILGNSVLYYNKKNIIQYSGGGYYKPFNFFPFARGNREIYTEKYDSELTPNYDFVYGASMFIHKDVIQKVGLLEEQFFIYFEELDIAYRAKKQQFKLGFIPKLKVYHKEGATISNNKHGNNPKPSLLSTFYFFKNKIVFTKKHTLYLLPLVYMQIIKQMIERLIKKEFKEVKMIIYILCNPKKEFHEFTKK